METSGSAGPASNPVAWSERVLIATLPSGRVAWLRVSPERARVAEVNELERIVTRGQERRAAALASGRAAIRDLATRVNADVERLAAARAEASRKLGKKLVDDHAALDRRLTRGIEEFRTRRDQLGRLQETIARRLGRRTLIDSLVIVSSTPLFAAFGQRSDPFAVNNLTLWLLLLVWLVGDSIVDALSGARRRSGPFVRDADLWAYVAPVANLLTGWLLLRNEQHERFATGFAESFVLSPAAAGLSSLPSFSPSARLPERDPRDRIFVFRQDIDLTAVVAPGHVDEFVGFADVPAVATITSIDWAAELDEDANARILGLSVVVDRGTLAIQVIVAVRELARASRGDAVVRSIEQSLRVAWMVDTKEASR